jgi:osmotically-inducible protein OsmY
MPTSPLKTLRLVATGALVAYFFDPDLGHARRVRVRDQAVAKVRRTFRRTERTVEKRAEYLKDHTLGVVHELTHPEQPPDDDRTLVDKIRSEVLGYPPFHGYVVLVEAVDGVVTLRGEIPRRAHIRELREAVAEVPGVSDVVSYLHTPGTDPPNYPPAEVRHRRGM